MRKNYLLLCGGTFPENRVEEAEDLVSCFVIDMEQRSASFLVDATLYGLKAPFWISKARLISHGYWQKFDTEEQYYKELILNAVKVVMIASLRMPEHALRVNLVSSICFASDVPFLISLL